MLRRMKRVSRRVEYRSLRDYVAVQPRQLRQGDIARRMGLSQSALSLYLRGHRVPSRDIAIRLSREFGISLEGLLDPPEAA